MPSQVGHQTLHSTVEEPLVSIIILNYNGKQHLKDCLNSVEKLAYGNMEVIFVDNASSDGSVRFVMQNYPRVKIIENSRNLGVAAGNNVGIDAAKGKYVFLLNPDTEVDPLCLNGLANVMDMDDSVGVCGAKIRLFDERERLQHAGGRYHVIGVALDRGLYELDSGQYDKVEDVSFVCGAALLFRKDVLSSVGLLDPAFFMYHEEVDFCLRMWLNGLRVLYVPNAIVYHKSRYFASLKSGKREPLIEFHKNKNTLTILLKNFDVIAIVKWLPVTLCYRFYWFLRYVFDRNLPCAKAVVDSVIWATKNIPNIGSSRREIMSKKNANVNLINHCANIGEVWGEFRRLHELELSLKKSSQTSGVR
jgi:GT2 family glycosyltransferase